MSVDVQVAHACPHYIRYELVGILGGREVIPQSPISGSGLLSLSVDGVEVPPSGLHSDVMVVFPKVGPYRFRVGSNNLVISGDGVVLLEIDFPARIFTQRALLEYISARLPFGLAVFSEGGSIRLSGGQSYRRLELGGSGLSSLGFRSQKYVVKSRELFPSWKLVKQSGSIGYKIQTSGVVATESILKISYTTEKSYCRRCEGTGVENDLRFGDDGNMKMVGGYDLLYQRVAKILLTERGSNPYHLFYGSTADRLIGQKVSAGVISSLKESVRDALDTHISIETQQAKVQEMSSEERLLRVRSVDVSMVGDDETSYLVRVSVESFSSKVVNINVVFAVPGSIPLDGDLA